MRTAITVAAALVLGIAVCSAQDKVKVAQPAEKGGDSARREKGAPTSPEEMAKRVVDRQAQVEKEIARLDEDAARVKDNPDATAVVTQLKTALSAVNDNLKAQAEAAKAGDMAKVQTLAEEAKPLEASYNKSRMAMQFARQARDLRERARSPQKVPVVGDASAAQQKYAEALTALADFYDQQAKNPPEVPTRKGQGQLPPEMQATETTLRNSVEKARIEFEFQGGVARVKDMTAKVGDVPAVKSACDLVVEKSTAVRDAQLKVQDDQDALAKARVAKRQADEVLEKAVQEQAAAMGQKAPKGKGEPGAERAPKVP